MVLDEVMLITVIIAPQLLLIMIIIITTIMTSPIKIITIIKGTKA